MDKYHLGNVETQLHTCFSVPSRQHREGLQPRDAAKLVFLNTRGTGELLWVRIVRMQPTETCVPTIPATRYFGALDSVPRDPASPLVVGDYIEFGPEHIIDWRTGAQRCSEQVATRAMRQSPSFKRRCIGRTHLH